MGAWGDDLLSNDHVQDEIYVYSKKKPKQVGSYLKKLMKKAQSRRAEDYEVESFVGVLYHIIEDEENTNKMKKVTKTMVKEALIQIDHLTEEKSLKTWVDPNHRQKALKSAEAVFKRTLNSMRKKK